MKQFKEVKDDEPIQLEPYCEPGEQVPLEVYEQWYGTEMDVIGDAPIVY